MANQSMNKKKPQRRSANNRNNMKPLVGITLAFVAVIVLLVALTTIKNNNPTRHELPSLANQQVLGDESAPVTVISFGDYMCPHCMNWDKTVFPKLQKDYIESGKVKYVFINTMFQGSQSQLASLASESVFAQSPEYFWDFHKALFDAQAQYSQQGNWVTTELLLSLAEQHVPGIDLKKLEEDLANGTLLPELAVDTSLVQKYNINSTPTIMINGIIMKNPFDYDDITKRINKELEASQK
jgi:protein-disulfide isomerase